MAKAKSKTRRGKGNDDTLETVLRFEIIVVLFSLIGLYYFLSFSPIRMPAEPITSPPEMIAPLPPQSEPQVESGAEAENQEAETGPAQVTVAAELPLAKPLVASVSVTTVETDKSTGEINQGNGSSNAVMVAEAEPSALPKSELTDLSPEKVKTAPAAVVPVSESQADSVPVTAGSAPVSTAAPLVAKPEPRLQKAAAHAGKSTAVPTLPTRTIVAGEYVLQVNLLQNRDKLEALNFKVKTKTVRRPTPMYRVYLGTFPSQKKAMEMMAVVRKKGDEPFLQACSGGYNVVIGSFYLHSSVVAWENMYHASGFEPKVQEVTLEMPHTLLLLDGPEVQRDPDTVLAKLKAAGFADPYLK